MSSSLKDSLNQKITKNAIEAAVRSSEGRITSWIIVEGEDDLSVYEKLFTKNVTLLTSLSDDNKKGWMAVETIVSEVKAEFSEVNIMGIRDKDYSTYSNQSFSCTSNVFHTDQRDLEMMLLASHHVCDALNTMNPSFSICLRSAIAVAREKGYLRIMNEVNQYCFQFTKHMRIGLIWDYSSHSMRTHWHDLLTARFCDKCNITPEQITQFVSDWKLTSDSDFDICQGHDVMKLVSEMMIKKEYSTEHLFIVMADAYPLSDFRSTQLSRDIVSWEKKNQVSVLRNMITLP